MTEKKPDFYDRLDSWRDYIMYVWGMRLLVVVVIAAGIIGLYVMFKYPIVAR